MLKSESAGLQSRADSTTPTDLTLWAAAREWVGFAGAVGLALLALHAFGVEPCHVASGWIAGMVWVVRHWESWALFVCSWALLVGANTCSRQRAQALLWQLPLSGTLIAGAVRGAWMVDPLLGISLGVLVVSVTAAIGPVMAANDE